MRTWKITNGIITKVSHEYKENYDGATKLNPISVYGLEYSYKVKDQEYSGVSSMKSSINSKYKAGDKIFVVFNPEDHSQSDQYESYFKYLHFVLLVPGIVLLIAGLIILF